MECYLQIPPPKPPPPEMHFIPNPANTEFICLLGLEECVGKILHEDKENTVQPVPFTCSQCGTDFTPTWKWDKGARGMSWDDLGADIDIVTQALIVDLPPPRYVYEIYNKVASYIWRTVLSMRGQNQQDQYRVWGR